MEPREGGNNLRINPICEIEFVKFMRKTPTNLHFTSSVDVTNDILACVSCVGEYCFFFVVNVFFLRILPSCLRT